MKKINLVVILLLSLFVQQVHSETNCLEYNFSAQNGREDELIFEVNDSYSYLFAILPSAQVFFNIVPESPVSFSSNVNTKNSIRILVPSKRKIIFNLSFNQVSLFSRYCSAFIQIFLRTACFRL